MQQFKYDLILTGGRVVDPQNGFKGIASVAVRDGKIVEVSPELDATLAQQAVDLLVTRIARFDLPSRHRAVPVKLIVRNSA